MATFTQALEWLKQGRKVRRDAWSRPEAYVHRPSEWQWSDYKFDDNSPFMTCDAFLEATDWQLYDDGQQVVSGIVSHGKESKAMRVDQHETLPADTSLTTELSVSPSTAAKILKLVEKEGKRKPRRRRKSRRGKIGRPKGAKDLKPRKRRSKR